MSDKEELWRDPLYRYYLAKDRYYDDVDYRLRVMLRNAKARSKNKYLEFDLDLDHLKNLWVENDGCCSLTGRKFILEKEDRGRVSLNAPSLDRIAPELGYVKGNVRLVTYQTNVCLHNFGDDVLLQFARDLINYNEGVI